MNSQVEDDKNNIEVSRQQLKGLDKVERVNKEQALGKNVMLRACSFQCGSIDNLIQT